MRAGRIIVVTGLGLLTVVGTATAATASPRSESADAGTARRPVSTVAVDALAAPIARAPALPDAPAAAPGAARRRPSEPGYPPTTGRLYLSASRVRVGSTVAAVGTGFRPRTSVLVIVQSRGADDAAAAATAELTAARVDIQRRGSGRGCATDRVCVVRANADGLALFTVRLTRVGRTTVTAIGLTSARRIQTLSATVRVVARRSGGSAGAGAADTLRSPARNGAPVTPMGAGGLLLTGVGALALRRRRGRAPGR